MDYDPGATKINQENRIKLMLANAKRRAAEEKKAGQSAAVLSSSTCGAQLKQDRGGQSLGLAAFFHHTGNEACQEILQLMVW